jgi:hypothetical protein
MVVRKMVRIATLWERVRNESPSLFDFTWRLIRAVDNLMTAMHPNQIELAEITSQAGGKCQINTMVDRNIGQTLTWIFSPSFP